MTVNVANINLMIEAISKEAKPIYMGDYVSKNTECGTTACLAGWANILRFQYLGKGRTTSQDADFDLSDDVTAAEWMGLSYERGYSLFHNYTADDLPQDERKAATIELLTKLRDTDGKATWADVLEPQDYDRSDDDE